MLDTSSRRAARTPRIVTVFVLFVIIVLASTAATAQDGLCDAEPRWLVVTQTGYSTLIAEPGGRPVSERTESEDKLFLLDRCTIVEIWSTDDGGSSARVRIDLDAIQVYVVHMKESLSELCRAMRDCGDATLRADR